MWFLKDLGRLNRERQAIESLERSSTWLEDVQWYFDGPNLAVDADIVLDESRRYPLRLIFPDVYPSAPAPVRSRDATLLSNHQYGPDGDLCLELGPDNWHPDSHTAALLLESAHHLLSLEADHERDDTVEIPSRHAITTGQELRTGYLRWVVTPAVQVALDALPAGPNYRCDVIDLFPDYAITAFLQRIERADGDDWQDPDVPAMLKQLGRRAHGVIVTRSVDVLTLAQLDKPEVVTSLLQDPAGDLLETDWPSISYVFHRGFDGTWQAHCRWSSGEKVTACSTLVADTTAGAERHGLDAARLADVKVAIVGLGSVGSKIATSLARSGVKRFLLVDDDLLHPANLVRHDGDWVGVGQHKVDAVSDRLHLINPTIEVVRRRHRLGGQEASSSAASAISALGDADLIVDATASPSVFTLCAHMARQAKKPLLWLEVFAGGIGGFIARSRPDMDAEPFTLRAAIHQAANEIAEGKGLEPPDGASHYGAIVAEEIVIASDADVSVLSGNGAQMAVDTLLQRDPSRFPHPAYLMGFTRAWLFEEAFHTIPIDCNAPVDWNLTVETDKATREDASAFIVSLLESLSNADAKTTP